MRIVLELVGVLNFGATVIGLMWRRRRQRRLSHSEYVAQKKREIEELDTIQEQIEGHGSGKLRP